MKFRLPKWLGGTGGKEDKKDEPKARAGFEDLSGGKTTKAEQEAGVTRHGRGVSRQGKGIAEDVAWEVDQSRTGLDDVEAEVLGFREKHASGISRKFGTDTVPQLTETGPSVDAIDPTALAIGLMGDGTTAMATVEGDAERVERRSGHWCPVADEILKELGFKSGLWGLTGQTLKDVLSQLGELSQERSDENGVARLLARNGVIRLSSEGTPGAKRPIIDVPRVQYNATTSTWDNYAPDSVILDKFWILAPKYMPTTVPRKRTRILKKPSQDLVQGIILQATHKSHFRDDHDVFVEIGRITGKSEPTLIEMFAAMSDGTVDGVRYTEEGMGLIRVTKRDMAEESMSANGYNLRGIWVTYKEDKKMVTNPDGTAKYWFAPTEKLVGGVTEAQIMALQEDLGDDETGENQALTSLDQMLADWSQEFASVSMQLPSVDAVIESAGGAEPADSAHLTQYRIEPVQE